MKRWLPALLVGLIAAAVYAQTLTFEFVYDDVPVIVHNDRIHSLAAWRDILSGPWWPRGLYRPFTSLTLAADWAAGGGSPVPFHLFNMLAHAVASGLVLVLAGTLLPRVAALAAGLLFAVHPVHVEAVANVVGRAEVLATVFVLGAALLYRAHGERPTAGRAAGTLVCLLFGLASKETAFAAPAVLLLVDWAAAAAAGTRAVDRFRGHWWLWAAAVTLAAGWLGLRAAVLGSLAGDYPAAGLAGTGLGERVAIMLPVVPEYLRLLFFPLRLSADYSPAYLPVSPAFGARATVGLLSLLAVAAVAFAARRRAPAVTAGLAWIGAGLIVVSNLIVPSGILLAERALYLASAGACVAAAAAWGLVYARRPRLAAALLAVVLVAAGVRTATRAAVWRDNTTLLQRLVRDAPGSYRSDWVAAMFAYRAGDLAGGERLMRRGFAAYSHNPAMWSDFARQMERERRWAEAADYFWNAYSADSQLVGEAARAVGNSIQAGDLDRAASRLATARGRVPSSSELQLAASHLALARGNAGEAVRLRQALARAFPSDWRYWHLTAEAAVAAGSCPELVDALRRVRALRPELPRLGALERAAAALSCPASATP